MDDLAANKHVVRRFMDAVWRESALARLPEFWTDDCLNHVAPAGAERGLAALHQYHEQFAASFAGFSDVALSVTQQMAEEDRVVTHLLTAGRHTGAFAGLAATGRAVSLATIRIDRLRAGKIAEHWSVADVAGLRQQLQA